MRLQSRRDAAMPKLKGIIRVQRTTTSPTKGERAFVLFKNQKMIEIGFGRVLRHPIAPSILLQKRSRGRVCMLKVVNITYMYKKSEADESEYPSRNESP